MQVKELKEALKDRDQTIERQTLELRSRRST